MYSRTHDICGRLIVPGEASNRPKENKKTRAVTKNKIKNHPSLDPLQKFSCLSVDFRPEVCRCGWYKRYVFLSHGNEIRSPGIRNTAGRILSVCPPSVCSQCVPSVCPLSLGPPQQFSCLSVDFRPEVCRCGWYNKSTFSWDRGMKSKSLKHFSFKEHCVFRKSYYFVGGRHSVED